MRVVILSARTGWHTDELCRALRQRGHRSEIVAYQGLTARLGATAPARDSQASGARGAFAADRLDLSSGGVSLLDADAVLARIIPAGSLEQIIFRVDALHWVEEHGGVVVNSARAIERCVDKFYTDALLREAGLPTPETVVCEGLDAALAAVRSMGDVILKPIFGSMGHGLVRLNDPDVAFRVLRALEGTRPVFYVQKAIEHGGRDIRAFVVGGRVIAAIERRAAASDWRANVARGARAVPAVLPPDWTEMAERAATVVGADYAGVDLVPCGSGSALVVEVNGIPGWRGLQEATGCDVAGAIVEHLDARLQPRSAAAGVLA